MGESLFNKYRPTTFEEVSSQVALIKILKQQVETKNYKNCYIFSGPSGTGKTTLARILAYNMNAYVDSNGNKCSAEPIEIDAASNNGVDNIRIIIDGANQRSLDGKYKVYIIDEAHMLTTQAWNALLKTIEQTPKYTVFIFCTTEYHKIPVTIQNRCQQYFLKRVPDNLITDRLRFICTNEKFNYTEEGLIHIAKMSQGSVRQAISYLEYCSDYSRDINIDNVLLALGDFSYDLYFNLMNYIIDRNTGGIYNLIDSIFNNGQDLKLFLNLFIDFVLDLSKYTIFKSFDIIKIPQSYKNKLEYTVNVEGNTKYFNHILEKLLNIKVMIKGDYNVKDTIEISLAQL